MNSGDKVEYVDPITHELLVLTYTGTRREVKGVDMDFFTTPKGETIFLYPSEVAKLWKRTTTVVDSQGNSKTVAYELNEEYFFETDAEGKKVLKPQLELIWLNDKEYLQTSGWPIYETDYGHCGLCGRLKCNGATCQGGG